MMNEPSGFVGLEKYLGDLFKMMGVYEEVEAAIIDLEVAAKLRSDMESRNVVGRSETWRF
jgi:hypothetical protein